MPWAPMQQGLAQHSAARWSCGIWGDVALFLERRVLILTFVHVYCIFVVTTAKWFYVIFIRHMFFFVVVLCFNLSFSSPFATCNMKTKPRIVEFWVLSFVCEQVVGREVLRHFHVLHTWRGKCRTEMFYNPRMVWMSWVKLQGIDIGIGKQHKKTCFFQKWNLQVPTLSVEIP